MEVSSESRSPYALVHSAKSFSMGSTSPYRARWKLAPDHPVTAHGYSERRSAVANNSAWAVVPSWLSAGYKHGAAGDLGGKLESPPSHSSDAPLQAVASRGLLQVSAREGEGSG